MRDLSAAAEVVRPLPSILETLVGNGVGEAYCVRLWRSMMLT